MMVVEVPFQMMCIMPVVSKETESEMMVVSPSLTMAKVILSISLALRLHVASL